jgi:hypothetical protein
MDPETATRGRWIGPVPMMPKEVFNNATNDDLQCIRQWTLAVSVVYSALAIALALFSFVIHERSDTTAARPTPASHVILVRE